MTIESILRLVNQRAQNTFAAGSTTHVPFYTKDIDNIGNQRNPHIKNLIDTSNINLDASEKMRKRLENMSASYNHAYFTVNKFKRKLIGNCQELSDYAFHELMKRHSFEIFNLYRKEDKSTTYITISCAQEPYDHGFVMVYHHTNYQTDLASLLTHIQPEAWICDPWADIVCKGSQYPEEWRKKMQIWYDNNHYVFSTDSGKYNEKIPHAYQNFFSPLRGNVYNAIQLGLKYETYRLAIISDTGELQEITRHGKSNYDIYEMNDMNYTELSKYYSE